MINTKMIPAHQRDQIGAATMRMFNRLQATPEGRAAIERQKEKRRSGQAVKASAFDSDIVGSNPTCAASRKAY